MLTFLERKQIADEYRKWLKEEDQKLYDLARVHIEDGPEAVIAFLSSKGYLQEDNNDQSRNRKHGRTTKGRA